MTVPSVGDVRGMREEGGGRREVYTPSRVRPTTPLGQVIMELGGNNKGEEII